jgi:hypothetical protein
MESVAVKEIIRDWMCRGAFEQVFHLYQQGMANAGVAGWVEEISPYDVGNEVKGGGSEKAGAAAESARHPDELKQDEKWVLPPSSPGSRCHYDFGYGRQTIVRYASRGH